MKGTEGDSKDTGRKLHPAHDAKRRALLSLLPMKVSPMIIIKERINALGLCSVYKH